MLEPIVIIDSSQIREGMLEDLKAAMTDLTRFVEDQTSPAPSPTPCT